MALLDHIKKVASKAEANKMTTHNLAVCFGPVLLCPSPQTAADMEVAMDFKKHIEVLHYLLDIWPANRGERGGVESGAGVSLRPVGLIEKLFSLSQKQPSYRIHPRKDAHFSQN